MNFARRVDVFEDSIVVDGREIPWLRGSDVQVDVEEFYSDHYSESRNKFYRLSVDILADDLIDHDGRLFENLADASSAVLV